MDGSLQVKEAPLEVSQIAAQITAIIARRHEAARARGDATTAARYDVSLDTIYFASLLLGIEDGTGEARTPSAMRDALDTAQNVIAALRDWMDHGAR